MALVGAGMLIGIVTGLFAGQVLASVLYGMSPYDPIAYGSAACLLAAVALLANWLPAHRAARIDPMVALRQE